MGCKTKAHGTWTSFTVLLVCCFSEGCPHPLCQSGQTHSEMTWFPGGPSVKWIPLPVPDPKRPWGSLNCDSCTGFCSGHFLYPEDALKSNDPCMSQPPSHLLKDFLSNNPEPTEEMIKNIAKETLLPVEEVKMWLDHLRTIDNNPKRGAAKAAETRRCKRAQEKESSQLNADTDPDHDTQYHCGICSAMYEEETAKIGLGVNNVIHGSIQHVWEWTLQTQKNTSVMLAL